MLTIFGSLLIIIGCGAIGFCAVARLNYKSKLITAWLFAIDLMAAEINYKLTPIPEIVCKIVKQHPILTSFFDYIDKNWQPWGESSYSDIWHQSSKKLDLSETDQDLIGEIGSILGQYNIEQQTKSLDYISTRLEQSRISAKQDKQKFSRMYGVLGIVSGIALIIILV